MRLATLAIAAFVSTSAAAPTPQFDFGALFSGSGGSGGLGNLGGLFSSFMGGSGGQSLDSTPALKTYDTIKTQVDKLNGVILKFSNATNPNAVLEEYLATGKATVEAYKASTTALTALNGTVSLMSAIGFLQPRNGLTNSTETALGNLISKKDAIAKVKGTEQVLLNLKDQKSAASNFSTAILARLPEIAQGIAKPSAQKPLEAFDKAITAFS